MPLSTYKTQKETVKLPTVRGEGGKMVENSFEVRGLSFPDVTYLVKEHLGDLIKIVELTQKQKKSVASKAAMGEILLIVARDFPALCTETISMCSGEEDTPEIRQIVRELPFPVQLDALVKIGKLTVLEDTALKNLTASLKDRLAEAVKEMGDPGMLNNLSPIFGGPSGAK